MLAMDTSGEYECQGHHFPLETAQRNLVPIRIFDGEVGSRAGRGGNFRLQGKEYKPRPRLPLESKAFKQLLYF